MGLRDRLRQIKAQAIRFERRHRPVLIFGQRRGGSTMVSDAVAAADRVWFVNEPFAVLDTHPGYDLKRSYLGDRDHTQFFMTGGCEPDGFRAYVDDLLAARLRSLGTARFAGPGLRADRVCLKILNAPWMLDWFLDTVDAHVLPMMRHPAGQALSVGRTKWKVPIRVFARHPEVLAERFNDRQVAEIVDKSKGERNWTLLILDWIVATQPMRDAARRGVRVWTYEGIVADPDAFVTEVLVGQCGLAPAARMRATFRSPSNSSSMSTDAAKRLIADGRRSDLLERWRRDVDDGMAAEGQRLLDLFEIDDYRF